MLTLTRSFIVSCSVNRRLISGACTMKELDNRLYAASWVALLILAGYGLRNRPTSHQYQVKLAVSSVPRGITRGRYFNVVISGSGPVNGTYAFTVRRGDGSEVISQSGEFSLEGVASTEVKKAGFRNLPAGDGYRASVRDRMAKSILILPSLCVLNLEYF